MLTHLFQLLLVVHIEEIHLLESLESLDLRCRRYFHLVRLLLNIPTLLIDLILVRVWQRLRQALTLVISILDFPWLLGLLLSLPICNGLGYGSQSVRLLL